MNTSDSGARYILTALLPRLEEIRPGLLAELVSGIGQDRAAIEDSGKMTPQIAEAFASAEHILGRAPA